MIIPSEVSESRQSKPANRHLETLRVQILPNGLTPLVIKAAW